MLVCAPVSVAGKGNKKKNSEDWEKYLKDFDDKYDIMHVSSTSYHSGGWKKMIEAVLLAEVSSHYK
jgi:hypothetical protein